MNLESKNIVFSTTRQWNPGDEIILLGVRKIFDELAKFRVNPVIFNRNPDLRSGFPGLELSDDSASFFDNSFKPDSDGGAIDWVVFAGTPEWCNVRSFDLYQQILKSNLPVMFLGVGGGFNLYRDEFREVIGKAKAFTVREDDTLNAVVGQGFSARQLPCPALLSAPSGKEKKITAVDNIALIYQASRNDSVFWGSLSSEAYDFQIEIFRQIISGYGSRFKFSIVVHYIDEIALASHAFPGMDVHYSYDSADYFDIYSQFDLVIGPRVHGIGAAASVGVPGIAISHDQRGMTSAGFLADIVKVGTPLDVVVAVFDEAIKNVVPRNEALAAHKRATMREYVDLVGKALEDPEVRYSGVMSVADPESRPPGLSALSEKLDRTDLALKVAQKLAIERGHEIAQLSERLDRTDLALGVAQALAVERGHEIALLTERLAITQNALDSTQALARERGDETSQLRDQLTKTHAGLEEARADLTARAGEIEQTKVKLTETEVALAEAQSSIANLAQERDAALKSSWTKLTERFREYSQRRAD
ncbi:polysaccharide pyruvyl transferase family protein [Caballeronia sordidicola]|uniref:polysaccharide pyruvyl transferase family protein n=1 Tax=Caballeronia sordidicola TaxID=196367 RepID=UPI0004D021F0|nr:polysaccharide pyruvyl transferase family protein [Caballeronia sordidicola]